jgi:hypothetical protein
VVRPVSGGCAQAPTKTDLGLTAGLGHMAHRHWLARDPVPTGLLLVLVVLVITRIVLGKDQRKVLLHQNRARFTHR